MLIGVTVTTEDQENPVGSWADQLVSDGKSSDGSAVDLTSSGSYSSLTLRCNCR